MISSSLLRYFPLLVVAGLALTALALGFNGLYGQDAHEYLRLCRVFFEQMKGGMPATGGVGLSEMAGGYPAAGALLHWLIPDAALSLLLISLFSTGLSAWLFDRLLRLWLPGTKQRSRFVFVGLLLVLSPGIFRAGITVMADALGMLLFIAALYKGIRVLEWSRDRDAVWVALFAGLASITRLTAAAFLLPFVAAIGLHLLRRRQYAWLLLAILAGLSALAPHFYFGAFESKDMNVLGHTTLQGWSLTNVFSRSFSDANGSIHYFLPNILHVLSPLGHPFFCLPVALFFLLFKKTDFHHPSQRILLACTACLLLFIAGLPCQNLRYLMPAYLILILFLYPAWDRFYAYGFYFFKNLTGALIVVIALIQVVCIAGILAHPVGRNRLETRIVREIQPLLPSGSLLFTFDIDGAVRSYLPEVQVKNLWYERIEFFPQGSYILFNDSRLRAQWEGKNPILNWDFARENYVLRQLAELPEGWGLFEVAE